jgi:hypothetical protein
MPNIPGIIGYVQPGGYTVVRTRAGSLSLPGGPRVICMIGAGQREEILVSSAADPTAQTNELDGLASDWSTPTSSNLATGRNFQVSTYPIHRYKASASATLVQIALELYVNGVKIYTQDELNDMHPGYSYGPPDGEGGTDVTEYPNFYTVDYLTGRILLDQPLDRGDQLIAAYIAEADFNDPETFTDPEDLYAKHGYPNADFKWVANATTGVLERSTTEYTCSNTLSLGATLAFENGAPAVMTVQARVYPFADSYIGYVTGDGNDTGEDFDLSEAYAELEGEDVDVIVPLTPKYPFSAFTAGIQHCEIMSQTRNKKERMVFIGAPEGMTTDHMLSSDSSAFIDNVTQDGIVDSNDDADVGIDASYGTTYRAMFFGPDAIVRTISGQSMNLDGYYIAAAAAGWFAGQGYLALPITRKTLVGFSISRTKKISNYTMNRLQDDGVSWVEPVAGGGRVNHGKTTTNSGTAELEEPTIIMVRDYVSRVSREIMENQYVGGVIDNTTLTNATATANSILLSLQGQNLITAFANLRVVQNSQEPRQIDVSFDVMPIYPLNWIYISFTVGQL